MSSSVFDSLGSSIASSVLLAQYGNAGLFSRITMTSMTSAWYHRLEDHVEVVLMCLVIFEILLMRYFLILPIDLTKLIEKGVLLATVVSKRKRRAVPQEELETFHRLLETALKAVHRIDEDGCFQRALCELENQRQKGFMLPKQLSYVLQGVIRLVDANDEQKLQHGNFLHSFCRQDMDGFLGVVGSLKPFHTAIEAGELGWSNYSQATTNSTSYCDKMYKKCSMPSKEMFDAINSKYLQVSEDLCDEN